MSLLLGCFVEYRSLLNLKVLLLNDFPLICFDLDLNWSLITFEVRCIKHLPIVICSSFDLQWPLTTSASNLTFSDLLWTWPLMTSNDFWGQNNIIYNPLRFCMGMYANNCIPGSILNILALFVLIWSPLMTSCDI